MVRKTLNIRFSFGGIRAIGIGMPNHSDDYQLGSFHNRFGFINGYDKSIGITYSKGSFLYENGLVLYKIDVYGHFIF